MLQSYLNHQKMLLKATQGLWDALEISSNMYVVFLKSRDPSKAFKKIMFAEILNEIKLVRAFCSYDEAEKYLHKKRNEFGMDNLYINSISYYALYSSIRIIDSRGPIGIECMLTAFDNHDNIYDIEYIAEKLIN